MGRVEGEFTLILHSFYLNVFFKKELTFLYMCVYCGFFLKREHPAVIAWHWEVLNLHLPGWSHCPTVRQTPTSASPASPAHGLLPCPGPWPSLQLHPKTVYLASSFLSGFGRPVSKPASPSGHPLPQGRFCPCAQSPWCPHMSSVWRSAHLEQGDERALLSQGMSGGDGECVCVWVVLYPPLCHFLFRSRRVVF